MASRTLETRRELKWQTQRSSGTPTAFRQFSLIQKQAAMMLPLFLSEWVTKNAECGGPNGMRFLPGPARVPLEPEGRNSDGMLSMKIARIATRTKRLRIRASPLSQQNRIAV
jgi:hypothetical protein